MPREKTSLSHTGYIVTRKETITTHWVAMNGVDIVRCDNQAKETGIGTWVLETSTGRSVWTGSGNGLESKLSDVWIPDYYKFTTQYEMDVS